VSVDRVLAIVGIAVSAVGIGIAIIAPNVRLIGWAFLVAGLLALAAIPVSRIIERRRGSPPAKPKTLQELFKQDFDYTLRATQDLTLQQGHGGPETKLLGQVYFDGGANSKFVDFFVPHDENTFSICSALVGYANEMMRSVNENVLVFAGQAGQTQRTSMKDATFSGQVVIYHQDHLSAREQADLEDLYRGHGLTLVLRGPSYAAVQAISAAGKRG
jgi:hypothetical protein